MSENETETGRSSIRKRRGLFIFFAALFGIWVALLIALAIYVN